MSLRRPTPRARSVCKDPTCRTDRRSGRTSHTDGDNRNLERAIVYVSLALTPTYTIHHLPTSAHVQCCVAYLILCMYRSAYIYTLIPPPYAYHTHLSSPPRPCPRSSLAPASFVVLALDRVHEAFPPPSFRLYFLPPSSLLPSRRTAHAHACVHSHPHHQSGIRNQGFCCL